MADLIETQILLSIEEILEGYNKVSQLYPHIPPMIMWRSWEYAAYKRYKLNEPVLDIGCGDGRFFHLVWPEVRNVVGIDIDPGVVKAAQNTGVYSEVHVAHAHDMPLKAQSFASAFANCSLEHMDYLSEVLRSIARALRPGGTFLLSVVTNKFIEWTLLPLLIKSVGELERAESLQQKYISYHQLVNPLTPQKWVEEIEFAGFEIINYIPILPELIGRLFLLADQLWHVELGAEEIGGALERYFANIPNFSEAFGDVLRGLLHAEKDWNNCCGAVFYVRKKL